MSKNQFFNHFQQQEFDQAITDFNQLSKKDQQETLKQLYYEAREAKIPMALGVLYRKLHDGKTFDDFYQSWMPPKSYTKAFTVGDKTYYHFFDAPTRVINAVNMEDPKEIISVGMVWCSEKEFMENLEQIKQSDSNKMRADSIAEVADKISSKIYKVQKDTNLGN